MVHGAWCMVHGAWYIAIDIKKYASYQTSLDLMEIHNLGFQNPTRITVDQVSLGWNHFAGKAFVSRSIIAH